MNALLVHGGKITAKVTKDGNPCLCAKTARNLLTQFHHAKIGLGLIIVKRHSKIMHETQDQVLILVQADEEIKRIADRWGASIASFPRLGWARYRVNQQVAATCNHHRFVFTRKPVSSLWITRLVCKAVLILSNTRVRALALC